MGVVPAYPIPTNAPPLAILIMLFELWMLLLIIQQLSMLEVVNQNWYKRTRGSLTISFSGKVWQYGWIVRMISSF